MEGKMEHFRYRSKARVIAIVDLILMSLSFCILLVVFFAARKAIADAEKGRTNEIDYYEYSITVVQDVSAFVKLEAIFNIYWILVCVSAVVAMATAKLFKATQIGKDSFDAAKLSRFWRNCTVFTIILDLGFKVLFLVFCSPSSTMLAEFIWVCCGIIIIMRFIGIYVVQQFIKELDLAVGTGILPGHRGQVP